MHILVVDDERWARKDLIRTIHQWTGSYIGDHSTQFIVEEAGNGDEAWKIIKQRTPDVLITDIRMPRMDGLQLIALTKQQFPHVICLIVSGYDDFTYAKQGIKHGVKDYLLKPIREMELSAFLDQSFLEITRRKAADEQGLRRKLYEWLNGTSEVAIPESHKWHGCVAMFIILSGNWHSDHYISFVENLDGFQCQPGEQPNMIVHLHAVPLTDSAQEARHLAQILAVQWLERHKEPMVHVAYELVESWSLLPSTFERLNKRLHAALQLEKRQIIHPEWQATPTPDLNEIWNRVRIVEQAQLSGSRRELQEKWEIVFQYLQRLRLTQEQLKTVLVDILVGVSYHQAGISMVHSIDLLGRERGIQAVTSYSELCDRMLEWLQEIQYVIIDRTKNKSTKQLLLEIAKDLENRYAENIRLKHVAETYGIHPSHLSRLFKEEYGMNFIDFMSNLRLQKAKQLLFETVLKPSEIAVIIGFSDAKYFGFWFMKMTGMSPSAYRKSIIK